MQQVTGNWRSLRSGSLPLHWDASVAAGAVGHLGCIKRLLSAASSDLKTLQWLRAQDPPCPWDARTSSAAAQHGSLEALIWMREQNPPCPWRQLCPEYAVYSRQHIVLQWLHDNKCPFGADIAQASRKNWRPPHAEVASFHRLPLGFAVHAEGSFFRKPCNAHMAVQPGMPTGRDPLPQGSCWGP